MAVPMSAGLSATTTPAASSAATFSVAVPLPPATLPPAPPRLFPRRDHAGTIRPDLPAVAVNDALVHANHIQNRGPFSDGDDDGNPGRLRFEDRIAAKRRGHKDHRGVGPGFGNRLFHRVEHRKP